MRKIIPVCALALALFFSATGFAAKKLDLAGLVTKADAAKLLGESVKDPKVESGKDEDGVYSTCTYSSEKMDRSIVIDVRHPRTGKNSAAEEFKKLNAEQARIKPVTGLGDKAAFFDGGDSGSAPHVCVLYVLKGSAFISVGIGGLDAETALAKEKEIALKLIAHL